MIGVRIWPKDPTKYAISKRGESFLKVTMRVGRFMHAAVIAVLAMVLCPQPKADSSALLSKQGDNEQGSPSSEQNDTAGRAMVPNDLFSIREPGEKSVSPDGKWIAFEVRGWARGSTSDCGDVVAANHRRELWVVARDGRRKYRITPKKPVRLSQWNPVWSPDSQQLAFLSNEEQANAFLEVWTLRTGRTRRLTTLGVDLDAEISRTISGPDVSANPVIWLNKRLIVTVSLAKGFHSHSFDAYSRAARTASSGITIAAQGLNSTAIVASDLPDFKNTREILHSYLAIIDTNTGVTTIAGEIPAWETAEARHVVLSPNDQQAAIVAALPPSHRDQALPIDTQLRSTKLGVVSLRAKAGGVHWDREIEPSLGAGYTPVVSWKKDSTRFGVLGEQTGTEKPLYLAAVDAGSAMWLRVGAVNDRHVNLYRQSIQPIEVAWLPEGRLAVRVHNPTPERGAPPDSWWLVSDKGPIPLTPVEEALLKRKPGVDESDVVKLQTSETGGIYETDPSGRETILLDLNPQLAEIDPPRFTSFEYQSRDNKTLDANIILPFGYRPSKRYPMVVWVYGGETHRENEKPAQRGDPNFLNLMLLAGHGYAVLIPSMPLAWEGVGDPMLHLDDGVDPAVNRAVELGFADPNRLALLGHSFGGYSVAGLLTLTERYRAAIAMMGLYDLVSYCGAFIPGFRYSDPDFAANSFWFCESGQGRMGAPLWRSPERYMGNSPVVAADKITTPLLITSGDVDFIANNQSEEMFTALNRQGKPVEFIRYLGEDHNLKSPANIMDLWQRIFSWLDTYLKP